MVYLYSRMPPGCFPDVARMLPECEDTHPDEITKKSNQNFLDMAKKVGPTPFDLGVINVVEYLSSILTTLKPEYENFKHKNDILKALGIEKEKWSEIVNHRRHVSTKPDRQAEIVGQLRKLFKVDPNYIYHYGSYQRMFVEDIVGGARPPDVIGGMSARELRATVLLQRDQINALQTRLAEVLEQVSLWKSLAQLLQKEHGGVSLAAESGDKYTASHSPPNPAKNPAKASKPTERKPRQ